MNGGNYNENIKGDYVQSKSIRQEIKTNKNGDTVIERKITTNTSDGKKVKRHSIQTENSTNASTFNLGDMLGNVSSMLNDMKQRATNQSMIIDNNNRQVVKGNNNQIIQQSSQIIDIEHMNGGHIGDNYKVAGDIKIGDITQVVQGNGNNVTQSIFTTSKSTKSSNNLNINEVTDNKRKRATEFRDNFRDKIIETEERRNKETQSDIKKPVDYWTTNEEVKLDPRLATLLDVLLNQAEIIVDKETPLTWNKAVTELLHYFELAPTLLEYAKNNQDLIREHIAIGVIPTICVRLFNKLLLFIED